MKKNYSAKQAYLDNVGKDCKNYYGKVILLKLSGEALEDKKNNEIYNEKVLNKLMEVFLDLNIRGAKLAIVVGGGNIYRGKESYKIGLDNSKGDYMGMIATVMNGLALKGLFEKCKVEAKILSSIQVSKCTEEFSVDKAKKYLDKGKVVIFTGGIGHPYFTTDTCAALRAKEIGADIILMAKNGIDGVYTSDPNIDKNAKFIDTLTYSEIINKGLKVIDSTAASLLLGSKIKSYIFNIDNPDNIRKIIEGEKIGTIVSD